MDRESGGGGGGLYVDHLRNFHCFAECKGVWWIGKVVVVGGGAIYGLSPRSFLYVLLNVA